MNIVEELIDALFKGLGETPLWETFLDKLREATAAHHAFFQCHPPGGVFSRAVYRLSGDIDMEGDEEDFFRYSMSLAPPPSDIVGEGKPFDLLRAYQQDPHLLDAALREQFEFHHLTALHALKVTERTGVEAWLFVTRIGGALHGATDTIFEALAPVLRGVVELYVSREQERYRTALAMQAARRAPTGWLTLDSAARVIEYDESCARLLTSSSALQIRPDGGLSIDPPRFESKIRHAVRLLDEGGAIGQHVFRVSRRPWIEVTLQPARRTPVSTSTPAVALMYVNHDLEDGEGEIDDLRRNLGLSKREADLAAALGRGLRIGEAAEDLGLTVLTVRSYLRSIYSKTGAAGLADLVRMVNRSLLGNWH